MIVFLCGALGLYKHGKANTFHHVGSWRKAKVAWSCIQKMKGWCYTKCQWFTDDLFVLRISDLNMFGCLNSSSCILLHIRYTYIWVYNYQLLVIPLFVRPVNRFFWDSGDVTFFQHLRLEVFATHWQSGAGSLGNSSAIAVWGYVSLSTLPSKGRKMGSWKLSPTLVGRRWRWGGFKESWTDEAWSFIRILTSQQGYHGLSTYARSDNFMRAF